MFCDGKCKNEETGEICGLLWNLDVEEQDGTKTTETSCGFLALMGELMQIKQKLLGVQQATESLRNNDAKIGIAAVNAIDKGFKRMAKVALLKEQPALAILDDE